jgi:NAD(P)H-dependent FMN reductase
MYKKLNLYKRKNRGYVINDNKFAPVELEADVCYVLDKYMAQILIINGSISGNAGNTAELLGLAEMRLSEQGHTVDYLELVRDPSLDRIIEQASKADAFIFGTGTYWDSWGSPLQKFFEITSSTEGEDYWLGKPVAAIVTAHAVGSKGILSRLFGVLNVYGMLIPPLAGFAYTFVNHVALTKNVAPEELEKELWSHHDVDIVTHNLIEAINGTNRWKKWPSDNVHYVDKWLNLLTGDE